LSPSRFFFFTAAIKQDGKQSINIDYVERLDKLVSMDAHPSVNNHQV